jgi:hypothetical protein
VGQLNVLSALYPSVLVPEAVWREVTGAGVGRPGARELLATSWTTRVTVDPPPDRLLLEELGEGEAEAITLAVRREAKLLLMDDRRAHRVAHVMQAVEERYQVVVGPGIFFRLGHLLISDTGLQQKAKIDCYASGSYSALLTDACGHSPAALVFGIMRLADTCSLLYKISERRTVDETLTTTYYTTARS